MGSVNKIIFIVLAIMIGGNIHAQQKSESSISGFVKSKEGDNILGASVMIESSNQGATTDTAGYFIIHDVPEGTYTLNVTALGYKAKSKVVNHHGKITQTTFKLEDDLLEMEEVAITIKSKVEEVKEQPYSVNSIDATKLHNTTSDVNQVLNKTSGIRVREDGGLGSNFNFSLNGFSGKQVKFFWDGVPMDNFGSSLSLNNIPINMAERIEVYKGVVPVELGSDALGGAVNIVTNQKIKRYADVSYSYGSFNTHRASVLTKYTHDSTGITVTANGFYNYSDNNYKINDVVLYDFDTGKKYAPQTVQRFHDKYKSGAGQVEIGVVNKKYADRLFIGFLGSANYKDIQQGYNMTQVFGQTFSKSHTFMPTFKYKKEDILVKNLSLSAYASYNITKTSLVDTSNRFYDWLGNYTIDKLNPKSGELKDYKSLAIFNDKNWIGIANLSYKISLCHALSFNVTNTSFRRAGTDPVAVVPIPFSDPNILKKNVMGLAYVYISKNKRLKSTVFSKWLLFNAKTFDAEYGTHDGYTTSYDKKGYGAAVGYNILPILLLKASYENTYRLPEANEMLGDGLTLLNNPLLKPEQSKNLNVGLLLSKKIKKSKVEVEGNVFYRDAKDFIRIGLSQGPFAKYTNVTSAETRGFDFTTRLFLKEYFFVDVNGTYQDIINTVKYENGKLSETYLDRIPNIPYLFGNADIGFRLNKFGGSDRVLTPAWGCTYVEQFWIKWPSQGLKSTKGEVPAQFSQRASITYSLRKGKYNATLECINLTNAKIYDNFAIQKPGRAFYFKLRYFFQ